MLPLLALALWALVSTSAHPPTAQGRTVPEGSVQAEPAVLVPPTTALMVHARPPSKPPGEARLTATTRSFAAGAAVDRDLGTGVTALQVESNGPTVASRSRVLIQRSSGAVSLADLAHETQRVLLGSYPGLPMVAEDRQQRLLQTEMNAIATTDDSGGRSVVARIPVPRAGPVYVDGIPRKGVLRPSATRVAGLISAEAGRLAFVDNSVNSAMVNLDSGARLELAHVGFINDVLLTPSGRVYAIGRDTSRQAAAFMLLELDPVALAVVRTLPTPIAVAGGAIDDIHLVLSADGRLFVYASRGDSQTAAHHSLLYEVHAATGAFAPITLPDDLGSRITAGPDGALYIFSGPGRNRVARVNPHNSSVEADVEHLRAPRGTYILALFVR